MSEPQIDIRPHHWAIVRDILQRHVPQYAVWAFGSRAKRTAKEYSDLDLAIITDSPLPLAISAALADDFSESDLPWKVDIVDWAETSEIFRKIIEKDRVLVQEVKGSLNVKDEWPLLTLREAGVSLTDCDHRTPPAAEVGYPYVAIPQLRGGRIELRSARKITPEHFAEWTRKAKPSENDIVLSRRCNPGETAFVSQESEFALGQNLVLLRANGDHIYPPFLRWMTQGPDWWDQVKKFINVGAVFDSLKCADVPKFELKVPPLKEQRAIAHILGTLDDRIELNRRMSETLEAMARSLFKSWFVDFDGVSAKDMRESELGLIPKGWKVSNIGSEVDVVGGSTPSTKDDKYWSGGSYNWATPKDLSSLEFPVLLNTDRKITRAGIEKITSGLLPIGTLLLSSRAPIGYLAIAEIPIAINQGFIAMKCNGALSNLFMLHWCRENMGAIVGNANGSTFLEISKANFRPLPIIVPDKKELQSFEQRALTLHQRIVENERQSQTLAQLRDTLLPKLMSGDVRIKDAERLAEMA